MRPGEYCGLSSPLLNTCSLFRLQDIQMWIGACRLTILTCPIAVIECATFATLTFTNQKNGTRGEVIGHDLSGHLYACPVCARRLVHLCRAQVSPCLTPLNSYHLHHSWQYVTAQHITDTLPASRLQIKSIIHIGSRVSYAKWRRIFVCMIIFGSKLCSRYPITMFYQP